MKIESKKSLTENHFGGIGNKVSEISSHWAVRVVDDDGKVLKSVRIPEKIVATGRSKTRVNGVFERTYGYGLDLVAEQKIVNELANEFGINMQQHGPVNKNSDCDRWFANS